MASNPTEELEERLQRAAKPEDFHSAMSHAMSALSSLSEGVCQHFSIKLACKSGCFLCCSLRVMATPPEVFLIAHHIQTRLSPAETDRIRHRLASHLTTIKPLTPEQHLKRNVECPLLFEGRCSVYPVRPFGCRYHHSQDFQACQFSYDHPEDVDYPGARHPILLQHLGRARESLESTYAGLGYDMSSYELGSALSEALDNSATWKRWRDGKKPFLQSTL
jgi:hypothetical protein